MKNKGLWFLKFYSSTFIETKISAKKKVLLVLISLACKRHVHISKVGRYQLILQLLKNSA